MASLVALRPLRPHGELAVLRSLGRAGTSLHEHLLAVLAIAFWALEDLTMPRALLVELAEGATAAPLGPIAHHAISRGARLHLTHLSLQERVIASLPVQPILRRDATHARVASLAARGAASRPHVPRRENAGLGIWPSARPGLGKHTLARPAACCWVLVHLAASHGLVHLVTAGAPLFPRRQQAVPHHVVALRLIVGLRLDLVSIAGQAALVVGHLDAAMTELEPDAATPWPPHAPLREEAVHRTAVLASRLIPAIGPFLFMPVTNVLTQFLLWNHITEMIVI
mmetsp:Transcript_103396/g.186565  ORF Transcript_103396/g.186565 Transcript_103396/m.186565 type:complete len:283 (+) Transcript_103396:1378-2226(+)